MKDTKLISRDVHVGEGLGLENTALRSAEGDIVVGCLALIIGLKAV
jgi:hypothetical protein